ncbi:hypothetical protein EJB05_56053, partial [Eragrostis curvula]
MALHLANVHHRMELAVDLEAAGGAGPAGWPTTGATPFQAAALLNPHPLSVFKFLTSNFESAWRHESRTFWKPHPVPNINPGTGDQGAHCDRRELNLSSGNLESIQEEVETEHIDFATTATTDDSRSQKDCTGSESSEESFVTDDDGNSSASQEEDEEYFIFAGIGDHEDSEDQEESSTMDTTIPDPFEVCYSLVPAPCVNVDTGG